MPFTFLSHQAPVLPLKLWRPRWFSGSALAIGSMAPDLEYFFLAVPDPVHGHSLAGQLYFCLPLTLVLVLLVRRVAEPLAAHLPDLGSFHLRDYRLLARARLDGPDLARIALGSLVGSFSHLLLDAFTHEDGRGVALVPWLSTVVFVVRGSPVPIYRLLQFAGSAVLGLATVGTLYLVGRRRLLRRWYGIGETEVPALRPARPRLYWGIVGGVATVGVTLRLIHDQALRHRSSPVFWGHEVLQATCFTFLGVCLATLALHLREPLPRRVRARS